MNSQRFVLLLLGAMLTTARTMEDQSLVSSGSEMSARLMEYQSFASSGSGMSSLDLHNEGSQESIREEAINERVGDKRSQRNIPAATDDQIREICHSYLCRYNPPKISMQAFYQGLPHIRRQLTMRGIKLVGKTLVMASPSSMKPRIVRHGEYYAIEYTNMIRIRLDHEYLTYITQNSTGLEFSTVSEWRSIADGFFQTCFPNLETLTLTKNFQPRFGLTRLQLGFLPQLRNIDIRYPINGHLVGCKLPIGETKCFADNMTIKYSDGGYKHNAQFGFADFHITDSLNMLAISIDQTKLKKTDIFEGKVIKFVKITVKSTGGLSGLSFKRTIAESSFQLKGGLPSDTAHFTAHLDKILHNPMIAKLWRWDWTRSSTLRVPVVFVSSEKQSFESLDGNELGKKKCKLGKDVSEHANLFLRDVTRKNPYGDSRRIRTFRGLYIDITNLIDRQQRETREFDEIEVSAFHVHISASRNVPYPLRVSYVKVSSNNNAAIYQEYKKSASGIQSKGSLGAPLKWVQSVDAVFIQAFKVCAAIHVAEERSFGGIFSSKSSLGSQMLSYTLPSVYTGHSDQISKAQKIAVKIGEFLETWKEVSLQIALKVPYLSLQHQQDNLVILLDMAESLVNERRNHKLVSKIQEVKISVLNNQDRATLSLLQTQYKRTVSQVLISTRRAHDIKKKLDATVQLVDEVNATFYELRADMEKENATFMAGVRRAQTYAYAEVASAVTSSIISFFSGGFDAGKVAKATKKVKELGSKIKRVMSLSAIFKKLANLIQILKNVKIKSIASSSKISGRMGRLLTRIKNFRIKRGNFLTSLIKSGKTQLSQTFTLMQKQQENTQYIEKIGKTYKKIKKVTKGVEHLNEIMQGIVEADKAKVALANAYEEGVVQDVQTSNLPTITQTDIQKALEDEFSIAAGDQAEQLKEFTETLKDYELTQSKDVIEEGEKLNAADVLEWDAANANIEGTMDASLSMDIPETTNFKAALLKMNLAGKVKTQAMIDEAAIRVDLDRARFETTTYFKEGAAILKQIEEIEKVLKKRENEGEKINSAEFKKRYEKHVEEELLHRDWREFTVKLDILIASLGYCSAYYYFHLTPCPPERIFDFGTKLEDIIHQQREVQRQSLLQLEDFYPPPQTMQNRTYTFNAPNATCLCFASVSQKRIFRTLYKDWLHCAQNEIKAGDPTNIETKQILEHMDRSCKINKVTEMKEYNRATIQVFIEDEPDRSRVRVDEVQVTLHGARTDNGVIKTSIESSGLSQDHYRGEVFNFYGDKWRRDFAYYSPDSAKDSKSEPRDALNDIHVLDAADVYKSFRSIYRTSTMFTTWVVRIDPSKNPGLDLSALHRIDLTFSGNFISSAGYHHNMTMTGLDEES